MRFFGFVLAIGTAFGVLPNCRSQSAQNFTITFGESVSNGVPALGAGHIESPGSTDVYTFTAAPGQVAYFQEQSGDSCAGQLFWRCADPTHAVLFDEKLANGGVCGAHQPGAITLTNGGTYTITVYGQTTNTGTYQFTVWNVTNQSFNLLIGESVSNGVPATGAGNIETPGVEDIYTFTATPGQTVYFEEQSNQSCGGQIFWRCSGPTGAVLFDEQFANQGPCGVHQPGLFTLTNGGTYTITVYGQVDGTGTYQFTIWNVNNQSFSLGIGQSVSNGVPAVGAGNIESPGTEDIYSFNAAPGQTVYFEEQSNDSCGPQIFWRCTDPTGKVLFDEQLANHGFCGAHQPGRMTLTNGGAYTITVYGQVDAIGTYQFALWNVTNQFFNVAIGQSISNGVPLAGAGNIETPGVEDIYSFTAAPGQSIYFEEQSNDSCGPQIFWRCTDSKGAVLFDELLASHGFCGVHQPGAITLTNGGTYTITAYGQVDATGTYQFTVWPVTNSFINLAIGQSVSNGVPVPGAGNIETPGVQDIYTFTAAPGQTVYFEEQSNDSCGPQIFWRCTDPTGLVLFDEQLANHGFCGVHQPGLFTLTNGGTYTITAYGQVNATGTYQFALWNVTNQFFNFAIGQSISNGVPLAGAGNIETPGVEDIYTFTAAPGQTVYFEEQSNDSCGPQIFWRCTDSKGAVLFDELLASHGFCGVHQPGAITLTNGGTYTITAYGQVDATGTYQFTVWPVTNSFINIAIGQSVSNGVPVPGAGNIETPGVQDIYTFTAAPGQTVYFEEQSNDSCGPQIFWRCTDPTGVVLFDEQLASHGFCGVHQPGTITLTNGGTYTITAYGQVNAVGTYQFTVWPVTNQFFNISLGQPVANGVPLLGAGNIETPGTEDIFTFTADPVQVVYFDEQSNDSCGPQIFWRCTDPAGAVLFDELIANHGFCGYHQPGQFTLTNGGTYTITAYGQVDTTGTYGFTVWPVTNQNFTISIGQAVSNGVPASGAGNIETPGVRDFYTFTAAAGEKVFFSGQSGDSCSSVLYWRCIDPTGALLFDQQIAIAGFCGIHDPGFVVLTNGGTYTITGYGTNDATGTYAFKVWKAVPNILAQPSSRNLPVGDTTVFQVVADSFVPLTYQWRFNGGLLANGTNSALGLTNLLTSQAGQYDVIVSNSFGAVTSSIAVLTIYTNVPDLVVTGIAAPAQAFAGQPVLLSWALNNQGNGTAIGPWRDGVLVSRTPAGDNPTYVSSFIFPTNLAAGQSITRTQAIVFPPSLSGSYYLIVQTDISNQVDEAQAETNNLTVATQPIQILPPDLTVSAVSVTPNAQFGHTVAVTWTVQNIGTAPAYASWSDGLFLSKDTNPADGVSLLVTNAPGPLAAGSNYTVTANVNLPLANSFGPGNYLLLAVADLNHTQPESNEANNIGSAPIALTLPPLPDLTVTNLLAPAAVSPGDTVTLNWVVTNRGSAAASGAWSETVLLSVDGSLTNAQSIGIFSFTNTLNAGASLTRTQDLTVPLSTAVGNLYFGVVVNSGADLVEATTNNNATVATNSTFVSATLTLQVRAQINENDPATTGTITRNGDLSQPLTVALSNSNPAHLLAPTNVVIATGRVSADFQFQAIPDHVADGPQYVTLVASAAGFADGQASLTVNDSDVPGLLLQVSSPLVPEGNAVVATITRQLVTTNDLTVFPRTSDPNHLTVPLTITIPANQSSNTFELQAIDDGLISTGRTVIVSASAAGYTDAQPVNVFVADSDVPSVQVTLARTTISEGAGAQATVGTVSRNPVTGQPVTLQLVSSNTAAALVPATVTIPANQAATTFPVAAVNDTIIGNSRQTLITPIVLDSTFGVPVTQGSPALLTVLDDDGPTLKLALARKLVPTGLNPATAATVSRTASANQDLVVNLLSSDVTHATVPATVLIPAGQGSASFNVVSTPNGVPGVNYPVTITASAGGFTPGLDTLIVANVNMPDLIVTSITAPATNQTEAYATVSYRISNQGQTATAGSFTTAVFLTQDPGNITNAAISQYTFDGSLPPGQFFEQTLQILLPVSAGDYWIVVSTDVGNTVPETLEDNNLLVSTAPIHVQAAYEATVAADLHSATAGTPVPMHGRASRANGDFAAQVPVNISILLRGTQRIISAQTDNAGNFTTTFLPLPTEAGSYQIGAAHPGDLTAPVQDTFTLLGMKAYPDLPPVTVVEQNSVTGSVAIANLSDVPLTSVSVSVASQMSNLSGTAAFTTNTLPGLGTNILTYVLHAADSSTLQGTVDLKLTSAEGASLDVPLQVAVTPLRARVMAVPGNLLAGMKRGDQAVVGFDLVNLGGAPTAALSVLTPSLPWLHVASTNPLAPLAPGATNHVTLQLTPAADLPVGDYTGALIVSGGDLNAPVPFDFRALSEAKGDLRVTAVDEYTYYAAGSPPVAGAAVTVSDPVSGSVLTNGVTDANGVFYVPQLFEGFYAIDVTADKHLGFHGTTLLKAGLTNDVQAFVSRETVQYIWTVTPTEIPEVFKIAIETTFETFVPIPVVTIEPNLIDLAQINAEVTQIPLRISNHGLVAANHFHLVFGSNSDWELTPLVSDLGTLAAKSSLTVPLTIRRLTPFGPILSRAERNSGHRVPKDGGGSCIFAAGIWDLFCGTIKTYSTPVAIANAGGCGGGGGGGSWGGDGTPGQPFVSGPVFFIPFDCGGNNNTNGPGTNNCNQLTLDWSPAADALLKPGVKILETVANAALTANLWTRTLGLTVSLEGKAKGKAQTCCNGQAGLQASAELSAKGTVTIGRKVTIGADKTDIDFPVGGVDGKLSFEGKLEAAAVTTPSIEIKGTASAGCGKDPESEVSLTLSVPIKTAIEGKATAKVTANGATLKETTAASMSCGLFGGVSFTATYSKKNGLKTCFKSDGLYATDNVTCFGQTFDAFDYVGGKYYFIQPATDCPAVLDAASAVQLAAMMEVLLQQQQSPSAVTRIPLAVKEAVDLPAADSSLAQNEVPAAETQNRDTVRDFKPTAGFSAAFSWEERRREGLPVKDTPPAPLSSGPSHQPKDAGGICAQVRLRLDQDLVLTRSAFNATLELINGDPANSLTGVSVAVNVIDTDGNSANDRFSIETNSLSGLNATDGTGVVLPNTTGTASWLIIPTPDAAPDGPTVYSVGGFLTYSQGTNFLTVPFQPVPITVYPDPQLHVKYFHQRDVFADDPFTPITEPSIPFSLAVMLQNTGKGAAKNVSITSAQPKIIDNQKGLLIDFKIISTEVAGQNRTPSLTVDFGTINPSEIAIGRWLLTSTLQGLFIDYSATLEHTGGPMDKQLALIDEVSIHEMIHLVQAPGAFEDGKPDFLVSEGRVAPFDLPDTLYLSDGSTGTVQVVQNSTVIGQLSADNLSVQLVAAMPNGWTYLNVPDPGNGQFDLVRVVRSDGIEIYFNTNVWTTDRTFIGQGKKPIYENLLHLLDYNSTGSYQLFYQIPQPADSIPPTSQVAALPAQNYAEFPVAWSGQDTGGSGLAYFDVYVSDNNGPFVPWVTQTTDTGDTYFGTLGHTYAFYSVATDNANNHEAPHTTPDAQTTISLVNQPALLDPIPDQTILQGDSLRVVASAHDPDGETLTFSLIGTVPAGMQIDPVSGVLTWVTGGGTAPGTNRVTVQVLDNGIPREGMTRSFNVIVVAGNTPPVLAPLLNDIVFEGTLLLVTNSATDTDLPQQLLTFSLGPGAPTNASINPATGLFQWRPNHSQINTTNLISIIVTDNGTPTLGATQNFTVVVLRALPDLVVAMGTTNLLVGQTSSVPVSLTAALDLTNVTFELDVPVPRLVGLSLRPLVPQLASAVLLPAGSNRSQINLTAAAGKNFLGSATAAQLAFGTDNNPDSAIVPLQVVNLAGTLASGALVTNVGSFSGRVFLIGKVPLLDTTLNTNQTRVLTVFGHPGASYALEYNSVLDGTSPWRRVSGIALVGTFASVTNLPILSPADFYRAIEAPLLRSSRVDHGAAGTALGLRLAPFGRAYELQASDDLLHWTSVATNNPATNPATWFDYPPAGVQQRYYRALAH